MNETFAWIKSRKTGLAGTTVIKCECCVRTLYLVVMDVAEACCLSIIGNFEKVEPLRRLTASSPC
jgi:hypothetical protein